VALPSASRLSKVSEPSSYLRKLAAKPSFVPTELIGVSQEPRTNAVALRRPHRDRRGGEGQLAHRVLQRGELALADRTGRDVRHHRAALGRIQCVERQRFERLACLFVRHAVAHPDPPPSPSLPSTCSWLRSFCKASRILVFTVPSGCPVRSAISDWLKPPK